MTPSLDIVIVNWNAGPLLADCVRSALAAHRSGFSLDRVVIVDNASSDGSCDGVANLSPQVHLIRNAANRGFAAACNQGATGSRADYLLFLNPDTRLFRDSLDVPVAFLTAPDHRTVGICGIRLVDEQGGVAVAGARFPTLRILFGEMTGLSRLWPSRFPPHLLRAAETTNTREVDQIIGAFFLVRGALFQALSGFDERFLMYFEEVDFSFRARDAGFRSMYLADGSAFHHGGYSSEQVRATRLFYSLRSRLLYAFKHWRRVDAIALVALTMTVELAARLVRAATRLSGRDALNTLRAYARLAAYGLRRSNGSQRA